MDVLWAVEETDEDSITTSYGYNTAKQLVETIRSATETTPGNDYLLQL